MSELNVIALIVAKSEHCDSVGQAVRKMVQPSRAESGCLQYDLHEEEGRPGAFVFIERWKSAEALKEHMAMPYHDAFLEALDGKLESLEVKRLVSL